ncbi:TadE/TadG family type IV pilus assembly protein [Photobacterium minamisatsumaniensis]|uniref:TadE/TadG family type IV pilus assembly protein n=1 Tax=Photobacterium minamisatsumaniensis TaxID=2910233 RepID=UPI003D103218
MKNMMKSQGVAIVEFTILLPIFLLLLFSIAELGRAFYTYSELDKISRDSARYLSNELNKGSTDSYILTSLDITSAKNLAIYGSINGGVDTAVPSLNSSHIQITLIDNYIKVEITYPYQPVLNAIPNFFGDDIDLNFNLTSSYSMRVL